MSTELLAEGAAAAEAAAAAAASAERAFARSRRSPTFSTAWPTARGSLPTISRLSRLASRQPLPFVEMAIWRDESSGSLCRPVCVVAGVDESAKRWVEGKEKSERAGWSETLSERRWDEQ